MACYPVAMPLPPEYYWKFQMGSGLLLKSGLPVASLACVKGGWEGILLDPLSMVGQRKDKAKAKDAIERRFK